MAQKKTGEAGGTAVTNPDIYVIPEGDVADVELEELDDSSERTRADGVKQSVAMKGVSVAMDQVVDATSERARQVPEALVREHEDYLAGGLAYHALAGPSHEEIFAAGDKGVDSEDAPLADVHEPGSGPLPEDDEK